MKTPYDVLGVSRNASDEAIRTAFRKAAKSCHPDLRPGDPTAEPQLRLVIAAYEILKNPQQRAAYDRYLRDRRREGVRGFAMTAAAGLASGCMTAALVLWLSSAPQASGPPEAPHIAAANISQPASQQLVLADSGGRQEVNSARKSDRDAVAPNGRLPDDGPRHVQQSAGSPRPAAGHPAPQPRLARKSGPVQASRDPMEISAFAARNPDASQSELARSKLIAMIDATDDVTLLSFLSLGTGAIAERAQQRLIRLGAPAAGKVDRVVSRDPSSNSPGARSASSAKAVRSLSATDRQHRSGDRKKGSVTGGTCTSASESQPARCLRIAEERLRPS